MTLDARGTLRDSTIMGGRLPQLGFDAHLANAGVPTILLDLTTLEAIDAAGVGELLKLRGLADAANGELWIDNPDRKARTLLDLAGLFELLSLDAPFEFERCS